MHRDRLRFIAKRIRQEGEKISDATEVLAGLESIVGQLDAAAAFLDEQTDKNAATLRAALSH